MLRLTHQLRRRLGEDLARLHGLSMADYDTLVVLAGQPDRSMRMAALADAVLQPRSSLSRIVGSLEQRGLVTRNPTPGDGRGASASMTPSGTRLLARAHRTHVTGIRSLFLDHLSLDQLDQLAAVWRAVDPTVLDQDWPGAPRTTKDQDEA